MKRVLICLYNFLPGTKLGGPLTTAINICNAFSKESDIHLVCVNHDYRSQNLYDVELFNWIAFDNYHVMYVDDSFYKKRNLFNLFDKFDAVYSFGPYTRASFWLSIYSKKHINCECYIAPTGCFLPNALKVKGFKKILFIRFVKLFKLYKDVTLSLTDDFEEEEAIRLFGKGIKTIIARDIVFFRNVALSNIACSKPLSIVFISRICRTKNLMGALEILNEIDRSLYSFTVFGTLEDNEYLSECQNFAKAKSIPMCYKGEIEFGTSVRVFSKYDLFLFPTITENFGHVIFESLNAGCIPLVSNNTPWRNYKKQISSLSLQNKEEFVECIKQICLLDEKGLLDLKNKCQDFAKQYYNTELKCSGYRKVFCYEKN